MTYINRRLSLIVIFLIYQNGFQIVKIVFRRVTISYPAKVIGKCFLDKAEQSGTTLTPMKLQKLIYYAHGWYLAIKINL